MMGSENQRGFIACQPYDHRAGHRSVLQIKGRLRGSGAAATELLIFQRRCQAAQVDPLHLQLRLVDHALNRYTQ